MKLRSIAINIILIMFIYLFFGLLSLIESGFFETINPFDYARITDVEYSAVLVDEYDNNSKVIITEKLTFDIHAAFENNLFWELWRDLPEDYVDGLKIDYKVLSVKQILEDGSEIVYKESDKLYWDDIDYVGYNNFYGPGYWYHSDGPYNEYGRDYEALMLYIDGVYREEIVFEIQYEMNNAALFYNDSSELYLSMYSGSTIKYLDSFKGEILIPLKDMPSSGNYLAYTYGTNESSFEYTKSNTVNPGYTTFSFDLDKSDLKFKSHNEFLEFAIIAYNEDYRSFTTYSKANVYSHTSALNELIYANEEYNLPYEEAEEKIKYITFFSIIGAIFLVLYAPNKIKQTIRKNQFCLPEMDFIYFREIPKDEDIYLAANIALLNKSKSKKKKLKENIYSAIMLSLVRKKYIELKKIDENKGWESKNVRLKFLYKTEQNSLLNYIDQNDIRHLEIVNKLGENQILEPLTKTEELYFNYLTNCVKVSSVSMDLLERIIASDYDFSKNLVKSMEKSIVDVGINNGYFQKVKYDEIRQNILNISSFHKILGLILLIGCNLYFYNSYIGLSNGAFFILGFAFLFSSWYLEKNSRDFIHFTQYGASETAKWQGLYRFLRSKTLMKERELIELVIWERYLVYATAFGISNKVLKVLKINFPEASNVVSPLIANRYIHSTSFRRSTRSFSKSVRRTSSSSSSFSRSYGGYGRGGGGGGGGH